jgi:hypothetical protein
LSTVCSDMARCRPNATGTVSAALISMLQIYQIPHRSATSVLS